MLRRRAFRSLLLRSLTIAYAALGLEKAYLRVLIFERDIARASASATSDIDVEVRELRCDDIAAYGRYRPERDVAELDRRLAAGMRCFLTLSEGHVVGELWVVTVELWLAQLERLVPLAPDELWVYEAFVIPELRGRNVATVRATLVGERLKNEGYRRLLWLVSPHNRPQLGSAAKLGARRLGSAGYVRLGPFRRDFVRMRGHPGVQLASRRPERHGPELRGPGSGPGSRA
jgi:GNAT superfamily N-acetyltransferase